MNRSYSKIRHIQEMNQRLDNKLIEEKISRTSFEFISEQGEKKTFLNLLEKQRLIEEQLKFGGNNLLMEQDKTTTPEVESDYEEEDDDIGDTPETNEDYEFLQSEFPNEWEEFQKIIMNQILNSPEAKEGGDTETLSESQIKSLLVEGRCNLQTRGLAHCIRYSKFGKWWVKKIGKPTKNAIEDFVYKTNKKFKKWMRDVKDIDLDIEFKKRKKKYKNNYKRKSSRKLKSLDKVWAKNKRGTIKIGRVGWLTFGKGRGSASEDFSSEEEMEPSIEPGENNKNYISYLKENESTMVKLMSNTSKGNWEELKSNPEEIAYAVAVLERFNETYEEKKWKKVGVGLDKETFIIECEDDPIVNGIPADEKLYPTETFEFPLNPDNDKNLFKDNEWDEANAGIFLQEVKELCALIQQQMSGLTPPKDKPKAYLEAMYLQASASRLRNGGKAAELSFKQLSENRLATGKAIMERELAAIGVLIDGNTKYYFDTDAKPTDTNPMGNGDGSSGPNPPIGKGYIAKGNFPMTPNCLPTNQTCRLNGKDIPRSECGTPHTNILDYDKYKFINGSVKLIFNDDYKPEPDNTPPDENKKEFDPEVEVIETDVYPIYFYAPGKKPFKIPLPGLRIKWKKLFTFKRRSRPTYGPPAGKKNGATKCEAFGG
jgi:hypothetical protein